MAKKINFNTAQEVECASNALKDMHIEHVLVEYPNNKYVVVLNRYLSDAKKAFEEAELVPSRIKNQRHYEMCALTHKHFIWDVKFPSLSK